MSFCTDLDSQPQLSGEPLACEVLPLVGCPRLASLRQVICAPVMLLAASDFITVLASSNLFSRCDKLSNARGSDVVH